MPVNISLKHVRKYGSAFLNSDGGVLLAGILDNGWLTIANAYKLLIFW